MTQIQCYGHGHADGFQYSLRGHFCSDQYRVRSNRRTHNRNCGQRHSYLLWYGHICDRLRRSARQRDVASGTEDNAIRRCERSDKISN